MAGSFSRSLAAGLIEIVERNLGCSGPHSCTGDVNDKDVSVDRVGGWRSRAPSTQRESVVGWRASTGAALGPVIGWQDRRTTAWCSETFTDDDRQLVHDRSGLRVDPMFSAPKMRWILEHLPNGVPIDDVRLGTVDSWLIWRLTAGMEHLCEAGNASRTLLYDIAELQRSKELLEAFGVPATAVPTAVASDRGFGRTRGVSVLSDGTPIAAVLADSPRCAFRSWLYRSWRGESHLRHWLVGHGPGCGAVGE